MINKISKLTMKINCFRIQNFRRFKNILVDVESDISILVGANNSGKTSATHALDMFVNNQKDKFTIYDFNSSCWSIINDIGDEPNQSIIDDIELPQISLDLWFNIRETDLHRVLYLLPDLTWEGSIIGLRIVFQPKSSRETLVRFMESKAKVAKYVPKEKDKKYKPWPKNLIDFLSKHLSQEYEFRYYSLDQSKFDEQFNQKENYTPLLLQNDKSKPLVKSLLRVDTLHAQRNVWKKEGNNIFCHLADIYEVSDISIKQKIARLFFPEKVIVNENILNMLPEFIKIIFGIKLEKSGARVGETLGNDEKINHFLKEISLFAFEQQLKTI